MIYAVFEGNRILKMSKDRQEIIDYYKSFSKEEQNKKATRSTRD
jgi:hypothetical protein